MAEAIMHNMIIEEEQGNEVEFFFDYHVSGNNNNDAIPNATSRSNFQIFLLLYQAIRSRLTHQILKEDIINHLCNMHGMEKYNLSSEDGI
ncbi:hypothetical protein VP01_484g3 [Puccinia sorghi]|uniref:Uncharacterized protein n=1 Tax=Puccinia sorghi TaxID=27349 RepID=A0A0L6UN42_9BASI|nr:hypothetical protein VP01_484g3 [Puccinia sorghi]